MELKYIELKSGFSHDGPAWIAYVQKSKTGQSLYFNGKSLKKFKGGGISGNYYLLAPPPRGKPEATYDIRVV